MFENSNLRITNNHTKSKLIIYLNWIQIIRFEWMRTGALEQICREKYDFYI